jgi:hypothetical protein
MRREETERGWTLSLYTLQLNHIILKCVSKVHPFRNNLKPGVVVFVRLPLQEAEAGRL